MAKRKRPQMEMIILTGNKMYEKKKQQKNEIAPFFIYSSQSICCISFCPQALAQRIYLQCKYI